MKPFNLKRLADEESASLIFTCTQCNKSASQTEASVGCSMCASTIFKVARYMPLIMDPLKNPYRSVGTYGLDKEDGDKLTTIGDDNSLGASGYGGISAPTEIHDGAEEEGRGMPGASSDSLLPEDSPLRNTNKGNESQSGGPQGTGLEPSGKVIETLFDRIRNERKHR